MSFTSPAVAPDDIGLLIARLPASAESPVVVGVEPAEGALPAECFPNVAAHVAKFGGEIAYGWLVWDWPGNVLEAEHHAVWRAADGHFVDVTPQRDGESRLLFVPDAGTPWKGRAIPKVRIVRQGASDQAKRTARVHDLLEKFLAGCEHRDGHAVFTIWEIRSYADRCKAWEKQGIGQIIKAKFGLAVAW